MHVDDPHSLANLRVRVPVFYMIFDILALDGAVLATRPYVERRAALEALALEGPAWRVPPNQVGNGEQIIAFTKAHGIEGVVAKRLDSRYEPGRHAPTWRKIKNTLRQEFVIGAWTPGERGRTGEIGALVLGVYEDDDEGEQRLRCVGRVGSGLTHDMLTRLADTFAPLQRDTSPFAVGPVPRNAHFVEPVCMAEVRFAQWTTGEVVRAAVFVGLRNDKDPRTIVRES
jgi:bifunctional non-homologous end joining protein LigD